MKNGGVVNKKLVIIVAAVVVLGGGAVAYFLTQPKSTSDTNANVEPGTTENVVDEAVGSIRSLFNAGKSQVCTYSSEEDSGTIYITDGWLRADMTSKDPESPASGMIITKEKQYFWDVSKKEGYVTQFSPDQQQAPADTGDTAQPQEEDTQSIDEEYNYNCKSWNVDESLFTPPADVNFIDMQAMLQEQLQQFQQ